MGCGGIAIDANRVDVILRELGEALAVPGRTRNGYKYSSNEDP